MELHLTSDETVQTQKGESLYFALKKAGIYLVASCGGKGTCGKCTIKVLDGAVESLSYGKLTVKEREAGMVLACQAFPGGDLVVEIPKESKLVIGDKIAVARSKNLARYLESFGVTINPPIKRIALELPPPTISDNISDLERLKRTLDEKDLRDMRFSHGFLSTMGRTLREAEWKV
ncbi:MAG TPA: 2Fe-2S iron-sulfur cluster-binding protein, partial [Dissulfurispiraceae bacterium]|nr:2Fe-2S iron-sulfur cluster-binding protein [Dissulfurispiraceae bacterium]